MKKTPEQEAVEEGAVGGVNNIETARPIPRKYKIDRDILYNSSREINFEKAMFKILETH
jgi:hypothetical protein